MSNSKVTPQTKNPTYKMLDNGKCTCGGTYEPIERPMAVGANSLETIKSYLATGANMALCCKCQTICIFWRNINVLTGE